MKSFDVNEKIDVEKYFRPSKSPVLNDKLVLTNKRAVSNTAR